MLEMLMMPKRAERKPWELFFIGLLYSSIALLLVGFVFAKDGVLSHYGGILVVTIASLCCWPFLYYIIRLEEGKDVEISEEGTLVKEHWKALKALMWLFCGLVVGFSIWYSILPGQNLNNFNAQVEVFCAINSPNSYTNCLAERGIITGAATAFGSFLGIFSNNVYVLIFTLVFSLALGAGAIFILAWNASVIGAAVGMFAHSNLLNLPCGLWRYMIHGLPEIAAYFLGALAGGIVSVAVIRKDLDGEGKWGILQDALTLVIIALLILVLAALMEVFLTPYLMRVC